MQNSPPFDFESLDNTLADFNGDGIVDVVHKAGTYEFYPNFGAHRFEAPVRFKNNPLYELSDRSVKFVDLNFDKRPAVCRARTLRISGF